MKLKIELCGFDSLRPEPEPCDVAAGLAADIQLAADMADALDQLPTVLGQAEYLSDRIGGEVVE